MFLSLQIELFIALVLQLIHVPSATYYWFEMRLKSTMYAYTVNINSLQVRYSFVLRTTPNVHVASMSKRTNAYAEITSLFCTTPQKNWPDIVRF